MGHILTPALAACRFGTLGAVAQHRLPCPSNADPAPWLDDDTLTDDNARDIAVDEVLATPAVMAQWLAEACEGETAPLDLQALEAHAIASASVPTLLALLFGGSARQALTALTALRLLAPQHNAAAIDERAAELLEGAR